jgi:hypothetical protein
MEGLHVELPDDPSRDGRARFGSVQEPPEALLGCAREMKTKKSGFDRGSGDS